MKSKLDRQIATRVNAVVLGEMLDRILEVVRHYKGEKAEDVDGVATHLKGMHRVVIAGAATDLKYESCGVCCEGLSYKVYYGGRLMFEAQTSDYLETFSSKDPRCIRKYGKKWMFVGRFLPGIWENALNLLSLIRAERAAQNRLNRARVPRPAVARERDEVIAQRFGLKVE